MNLVTELLNFKKLICSHEPWKACSLRGRIYLFNHGCLSLTYMDLTDLAQLYDLKLFNRIS